MAKFEKKATSVAEADEPIPNFEVAERMALHGTAVDMRESEVAELLREDLFPMTTVTTVDPRRGATIERRVSSMTTTWIHAAEAGRLHHVTNVLGWKPVQVKWLKPGTMSGAWASSPEGYLTRGEKGEDVACLMPRQFHEERMRKMAVDRSTRARDVARLKQNTAESLAASGEENDLKAAERIATARMEVTHFKETKGPGAERQAGDGASLIPDSEVS